MKSSCREAEYDNGMFSVIVKPVGGERVRRPFRISLTASHSIGVTCTPGCYTRLVFPKRYCGEFRGIGSLNFLTVTRKMMINVC
jgi:hypothetical protein